MKLKVKFPLVKGFRDYHDIGFKEDDYNEIFDAKIKSKEIAFDGEYWAVFYVGKLPKKEQLKKLLLDAGWTDNLEHSEFLGENVHFQ